MDKRQGDAGTSEQQQDQQQRIPTANSADNNSITLHLYHPLSTIYSVVLLATLLSTVVLLLTPPVFLMVLLLLLPLLPPQPYLLLVSLQLLPQLHL
jgi:hypothetical protein